ncbi:MAG: MarR family transcriptional regulator [Eubacteriales bacterium]|nr:MarR family transcriptional regulator [Eubacteriales bacterium]
MDEFSRELNQLLVNTYHDIGKLEESMLHSTSGMDLSIGEMHMLEAVGTSRDKGLLVCELAQRMELTPPTVTVAVNKLAAKGYVVKTKSQSDKRSVIVTLTRAGQRVNVAHRYFHENMIRSVEKLLTPSERDGMMHGMRTLNEFFRKALDGAEKPEGESKA